MDIRKAPGSIRGVGLHLAVIVVLGLAATGCGSSNASSAGAGDGVASNGGSTGTGTAADGPPDNSAALVKYAQCMRENGVPEFPDPVDGRLQIRAQRGGALDPESPAFQSAQKACKSAEPPGLLNGQGPDGNQQDQLLKYVACMRKNGVPKFPDPQNGRIQLTPEMGVDPQSPQFKKAEDACRDTMPGGVSPGGS